MLDRAAAIAPHDYASEHRANRDFFGQVIGGALARLVERPGFVDVLQPAFVRHMLAGVGSIKADTGATRADVAAVRSDTETIRADVSAVRQKLSDFEAGDAATARAIETMTSMLDRVLVEGRAQGEEISHLRTQLADAVATISDPEKMHAGADRMIEARSALERGDTTLAERLLEEEAEHWSKEVERAEQSGSVARRRAAKAWRHQGVLAYLHDTDKSLRAYRCATRVWPEDADAWNELGHLQRRLGRFDQAEHAYQIVLDLAGQSDEPDALRALGHGNLGLVHLARGELNRAEASFKASLELNRKLTHVSNVVDNYNNLAIVYRAKGELDRAEKVHEKLIELNRALNREAGLATAYGNLGLLLRDRGKLAEAEGAFEQSLAIDESLGRTESAARSCDNLGVVYRTRGELDRAEAMHERALDLHEELGHQEGIANALGNLGILYLERGEYDRCEVTQRRALQINEALGSSIGVVDACGNLGTVHLARGEFGEAEAMHARSLAISETLGYTKGAATSLANLGIVYANRGDCDEAATTWRRAYSLLLKIGSPDAEVVKDWLAQLDTSSD